MKKIVLCLKLSLLTLLVGMGFTSCSSDDGTVSTPQAASLSFKPAKPSEIALYSGGQLIASTANDGTRAAVSGQFQYYKVQDNNIPAQYQSAIPAQVSNDEKTFVINYIKEHPNDGTTDYDHNVYFVQYVGGSNDTYSMKDQNNASHSVTGSNQMDQIAINGNFLNDYNAGGGPDALVENLHFANPSYHDSYGDVDNVKTDAYKIYRIPYDGKIGYYLGFDYKTKKNSGENFAGDGIYNDYVIKLTSADGNPDPDPVNPVAPGNGEVETNLSLNDQKDEGDFISTKLSIHVRDTTDVEVFIPVPAEYYCRVDDMNIVLSHKDNDEKYNNSADNTTMSYTIDGQSVTLTVSYELDGIRVTTKGINAILLKYLRNRYGDGITFEIWNYYKNSLTGEDGTTTSVTRDELQSKFLNNSTISFLTRSTGKYINAFGAIPDYKGNVYDKVDASTGVRTPYTDSDLTQELSSQYWKRSTTDPRYYVLNSSVNALDCTVVPANTSYKLQPYKEEDGFNKIYQ